MDTPFKVILPDGTTTEHHADLIAAPGYETLRDLIVPFLNGRDLEHVAVLHEGERTDMFVDDMGAVDRLPRNEVATAIYRNNWLTQHPDADPEELSAIYGPAILFSRRVWF